MATDRPCSLHNKINFTLLKRSYCFNYIHNLPMCFSHIKLNGSNVLKLYYINHLLNVNIILKLVLTLHTSFCQLSIYYLDKHKVNINKHVGIASIY